MTFNFLEAQREGAVERVTLNSPDVRNAFNPQVIAELHAWAQRTAACEAIHIVVIAGAGKVFSAGADLEWMARGVDLAHEEIVAEARALHEMFTAIDQLPQAVIGRVHGAAIAGGAGLLAVCDAVVAADDTVFGFTEVKLGIVPAIISPFVMAKIGTSAARELFVTGTRFNAMRAREIGLIHRVVPFEQLDAVVDDYVAEMSSANPAAMTAAKALVRNVAGRTAANAFEVTGPAIAARRVSADARAAMRAFLDKRLTGRQDG
jgi:methylglutaconyl-CoA hydratase